MSGITGDDSGPEDNAEWLRWAADVYASAVAKGGSYAPEPNWDVSAISPGLRGAADEIERLRVENNHLRSVGMGRPSAELHEAALAELRDQIERLRARVEVLERALRRIQATPHPSVAAQCTNCYGHQKTATYALEDAAP
jgi:hypothetical protein